MIYKLLFAFILCIILFIVYYIKQKNGIYIKSNIDNQYYFVKNINDDSFNGITKQQIADTLAIIKLKIKILIKWLQEENNKEFKPYLNRLINKINNIEFEENLLNNDSTSYSVNKGEELVFCLKSKKTGKLHDINLIMYVVLHEIAHIMCPEYGHGPLFIKIFKYITEESIKLGIYKKIDFENNPQEYCGMVINSSII